MASDDTPPTPEELQADINAMSAMLQATPKGHKDEWFIRSTLTGLRRQLEQANRASAMVGMNSQPQQAQELVEPPPSSSRKRNLSLDADKEGQPDPKRLSAQPSPRLPGTPEPFIDAPVTQQRQGQRYVAEDPTAYLDLTVSDPPSPDAAIPSGVVSARPAVALQDPFAELDNAFRVPDDGAPGPADAFNQEAMTQDELAAFLIAPTPANGGFAYQQQQQGPETPAPVPGQPQGFARDIPYLPDPELPYWMAKENDTDSEEYGTFPLNGNDADAIEKMLEIIRDDGSDDRAPTPAIMKSQLKEYQKIGLKWLLKMEDSHNKGGILADEMGLGKTVQALALICARPSEDARVKTTLIIAPVALMRQWQSEIAIHVKPLHKLSVYLYHGNGKKADFNTLRHYDVVLTTFGTLMSEFKQKESRRETMLYEREVNEPDFKRKSKDKLALLGRECMWYRIIMDEAHMIKNRNSKQSKASVDLQARFRLCLTGTPMMNSIEELYPLLRFLKVDRYNDWKTFAMDIAKPVKNKHPETRKKAINRVQILLKAVMLRRQKTSEVDGKPILNLPAKHTKLDSVEFSDEEQEIYKALETKSQIQFNKYLRTNSVSANYACILVLLLRLRQACCHPHLIKDLSQPATEGIAEDDLLERARHLDEDVVRRMKEIDSFECPICFEADPNPTIILPCGHTVCGECVQKLIDPSRPGQEVGEEASQPKCPHCRGDLMAKLITDYRHFCKVHCPERLAVEERDMEEDHDSDSDSDDDEIDDADDVDEKGNLADFVVDDEENASEAEDDDNGSDAGRETNAVLKKKKKSSVKSTGKGKGKARAPKKSMAQLKKEGQRNKAAKKKYLRRLDKTWIPSAKILETVRLLENIRQNDPTEKTLIFSQFTSLLDLVEVPLIQKRFKYERYDGSMSLDARADAVEAFMNNPEVNIMVVSLKAGNAGLNLWKASQVIMLDPFWNPFVEEQAVDRAHRMPQPREVTVHRVLVPETVEDRICALQEKKREIIGAALDENASKGLARLNVRELKFLFGMS